MPGYAFNKTAFKDQDALKRYLCPSCELLLKDPVQPTCGHRLCKSCAEDILKGENRPTCPQPACGEEFDDEDGAFVSGIAQQLRNCNNYIPIDWMMNIIILLVFVMRMRKKL